MSTNESDYKKFLKHLERARAEDVLPSEMWWECPDVPDGPDVGIEAFQNATTEQYKCSSSTPSRALESFPKGQPKGCLERLIGWLKS